MVTKKPEISLKNRALQYLARREYSRAELRDKLLKYLSVDDDFEQQTAVRLDDLLDDLTSRGWLSDQRAAAQLVDRKRGRFGLQRITYELQQKGLSESLIDEVIPGLKETELDAAHEVWSRKFGVLPQDAKEKARQMRFLQARGFSVEIIYRVLRNSDLLQGQ